MGTNLVVIGVAVGSFLLGNAVWAVAWLLAIPFIDAADVALYGAVFLFAIIIKRFLSVGKDLDR